MFYDTRYFPFVETLERNAAVIRDELATILHEDFETYRHFTPWKVFIFQRNLDGKSLEDYPDNRARCPRTWEIIESIPGVTSATFSRLMPGMWLWPHRCEHTRVRCHLGLVIVPKCGIRVGGMTRHWEEGKCMIFNATHVHEAWNYSDQLRTVLLVDVNPDVLDGPPERYAIPKTPAEQVQGVVLNAHYRARKAYFQMKSRLVGGDPDPHPH